MGKIEYPETYGTLDAIALMIHVQHYGRARIQDLRIIYTCGMVLIVNDSVGALEKPVPVKTKHFCPVLVNLYIPLYLFSYSIINM